MSENRKICCYQRGADSCTNTDHRHTKKIIIATCEDTDESAPCNDFLPHYGVTVCADLFWRVVAQDFCKHYNIGRNAVTFFRRGEILLDTLWVRSLNDELVFVEARLTVGWKVVWDNRRLLANGVGADIVLKFDKSVPPLEIAAHRCILAQRSEKFSRMFYGANQCIESQEKVVLLFADCEELSIRGFVEFLYTDDLSTRFSYNQYFELLHLADEYLAPRLKTACEERLFNMMPGMQILRFVGDSTLCTVSPVLYRQGILTMNRRLALKHMDKDLKEALLKRPTFMLDMLMMQQFGCLAEEVLKNDDGKHRKRKRSSLTEEWAPLAASVCTQESLEDLSSLDDLSDLSAEALLPFLEF